jgi:hypothetical protein
MRTFSGWKKLKRGGLLWIAICGLAVPAAFGQNANQWYGWAQCEVTVQGPAIRGRISAQLEHQWERLGHRGIGRELDSEQPRNLSTAADPLEGL